ncbi:DNA cytosine methyltransferase [Longimicrobium sp.]|uniref:DNA cytosine methyltransferase n=1 Tax=Longimicrobium sp. TaxID=2029185 RepID=UPI0032C2350F
MDRGSQDPPRTFIDLFAGCGGFSLGLMNAGWKGLFAIEKSPLAFETLKHNLVLAEERGRFDWPQWLPTEPHEIGSFVKRYRKQLKTLQGEVDLVVGGPPCQGFSFAGQRRGGDERNELFMRYIAVVSLIQPKYLLLENVAGIQVAHGKKERADNPRRGRPRKPFSEKIRSALERQGYEVRSAVLRASQFGVAQHRPRFIIVGVRRDLLARPEAFDPFEMLAGIRGAFLERKGIPTDRPISAGEALSDLMVDLNGKRVSTETPGFCEIDYKGPLTPYQKLLNGGGIQPNSLRLANHRPDTIERFKEILETCRKGVGLSVTDRERLGLKKHHTVVLDQDEPSHTLTTLPDDLLHYMEPRILTVREYARLQSFPDWFEFRGKYTTGGKARKQEAPRYTQVGNAVPPLLAECLGELIEQIDNQRVGADPGLESPRES